MMELTINGEVYQFNFGMGFMREINAKATQTQDGVKRNVGFQYAVADVLDGNVEGLVTILDVANKGQTPRVTKALLDAYIDDEDTDIDALFEEVQRFFEKGNATKKVTKAVLELVEAEKAKRA